MSELDQPVKQMKLFVYTCKYEPDVEKCKRIVEETGGIFESVSRINFLNYRNYPISFQYACLYHHTEELQLETLC